MALFWASLALATMTSTGTPDLVEGAEVLVRRCGLSTQAPSAGKLGGALEAWTVRRVTVDGAPRILLLLRAKSAQGKGREEWRRWLVDESSCRTVGLITSLVRGRAESAALWSPFGAPILPAEQRLLLSHAGYRPCEAAATLPADRPSPLPASPEEAAPGAITRGEPEPLIWEEGPFVDPRLCWSKAEPTPRPAKVTATTLVPSGARFVLRDLGGSAEACRLMGASCDGQPLSVEGRRVQVLSLDARGATILLVEATAPHRHTIPVASARGLKLLGRYEDLLWLSVPGPAGLGFTVVAVDLERGRVVRLGLQPESRWTIDGVNTTGLAVRDVDYLDALANAETYQDRRAVDDRYPVAQIPWRKLAEAARR